MAALVADTHAAIWYLLNDPRLSKTAAAMDITLQAGEPLYVPSICLVEMTYLVEKGRVPSVALARLRRALSEPSFGFVVSVLDLAVVDALPRIPRDEVPDLPDRVIAATALAMGLSLVSRDRRIRTAEIQTIW